jgi:DNA-binding NarL/FixJ family response regulator
MDMVLEPDAFSAEHDTDLKKFNRVTKLTPTQLKVIRGVHAGMLNKQIAHDLGIAEATVKAHMTAVMRKLNVRNRTQVAIAAEKIP